MLRGGKLVATLAAADADKAQLAEAMVGRAVPSVARERGLDLDVAAPPARIVCALHRAGVRGAGRNPALVDVSLELHAGEIVAIAGVAGNGQRALADLLCGLLALDSGTLEVMGRPLPARPRGWIAAGVARIPEDRHAVGVDRRPAAVGERDARALRTAGVLARWGCCVGARGAAHARTLVERFDVRGAGRDGLDTPARALSGGNMQKLILGRALSGDALPRSGRRTLIVADQPTWGLDIGAVAYRAPAAARRLRARRGACC